MTSRKYFLVICLGLATGFCGMAGAFAQELPPWDQIKWVERRYKVEAMSFKARDETGIDWWGSDEVVVGTTDQRGWTASEVIENIDSGDTHKFDAAKSCLVGVSPGSAVLGQSSVCGELGLPAPLWFEVELWEIDWSPPGFTHGCAPVPPGGHAGKCPPGPPPLDYVVDDFIGHARIDLLTQDLEPVLPHIGDEYIETVVLFPCEGEVTECGGNLPDYTFTYRITRLPNARLTLGSVLDEAMRRSEIRSELEAIAAGLRALRAPRPRQVVPQTDNLSPKR